MAARRGEVGAWGGKLMDGDERKIAMLIAAFDEERQSLQRERQNLQAAISALTQLGGQLRLDVIAGSSAAAAKAFEALQPEIYKARHAIGELQSVSLWRSTLQHAVVALSAIAVTLLAVWWYVPPLSEINDRRAERDQLEASIADLTKRGAKIDLSTCGTQKRLCVSIDEKAGRFGDQKVGEFYVIPKGY
jgi:hypothetical protein